jgi:DNA-binding transcriptional MerR regulator
MIKDLIEGQSRSLNLTISEIKAFLGDSGKRPAEAKLRDFLHEKLADLSKHWYKRGVKRGHMESYKEWKATRKVSKRFRYKATREFFDGQKSRVRVTSKIKS